MLVQFIHTHTVAFAGGWQWGRRHYGNISLHRFPLFKSLFSNQPFLRCKGLFDGDTASRMRRSKLQRSPPHEYSSVAAELVALSLSPLPSLSFAVTRNVLWALWHQHLRKTTTMIIIAIAISMEHYMSSESLSVADSIWLIYTVESKYF